MNENTLNLIKAIAEGDALETEKTFQAAMAEKISAKLEDMRVNIAKSMFNPVTEEQQDEQEDIEEAYVNQAGTGRSKQAYHDAGMFDKATADKHAKTHNGTVHQDASGKYYVKSKHVKAVKEDTITEDQYNALSEEEKANYEVIEMEEGVTDTIRQKTNAAGHAIGNVVGTVADVAKGAASAVGKVVGHTAAAVGAVRQTPAAVKNAYNKGRGSAEKAIAG